MWGVRAVKVEPVTKLTHWQVFSIPSLDRGKGRDHHFNGRAAGSGDPGRVSSRIVEFDSETMTGITRSGRKYQLVGPPTFSGDPAYVWYRWCEFNKVVPMKVINVTDEYEGDEDESV
jgi:hypothetical protein